MLVIRIPFPAPPLSHPLGLLSRRPLPETWNLIRVSCPGMDGGLLTAAGSASQHAAEENSSPPSTTDVEIVTRG